MRDIIDTLDSILTESTGLAGRKPGDVFRNPEGNEIVFSNIDFFPEGGGKLENDEIEVLSQQLTQQFGEIEWQNNKTARSGGIAIVTFTSPDGNLYIGRYLEQIKADPKSNYIPNKAGDYSFASKSAAKTQDGLTPQDLLKEKFNLTVPDILKELSVSLGTSHPLYKVAHELASGTPLPISFPAPSDISFSAFRDYFCEILQPIALQNGQFTGNAGEAAAIFLGGSFKNTLISFDDSKTAGLSDSLMTATDGREVKISTKGGAGAKASVKNLLDSIDELSEKPGSSKLLKKHEKIVKLLREIKSQGQAGSPLYLGTMYDVITEEEALAIKSLKQNAPIDLKSIQRLGLSENLVDLALTRKTDNPKQVNMYFHLIAAVAFKAAAEVNKSEDFSKAASEILNNSALIQVYTKAKEGKVNWSLDEFTTVYPGKSISGVSLSAGKTYYSTGIKGNFTFVINRGGSKIKDPVTVAPSTSNTQSSQDFAKDAAAIATGTSRKPISDKPKTAAGVGRKKR